MAKKVRPEATEYLRTGEAAELLGVHKRSVLNAIARGTLPALKLSKRTFRVSREALAEYGRRVEA